MVQEQIQVYAILKTGLIYYPDIPSCVGDCFVCLCLCFLFLPFFLKAWKLPQKSLAAITSS